MIKREYVKSAAAPVNGGDNMFAGLAGTAGNHPGADTGAANMFSDLAGTASGEPGPTSLPTGFKVPGEDCSLFSQKWCKQSGIDIPRTAIQQYRSVGKMVLGIGDRRFDQLKPGDLLFWDNGKRTKFNTEGKAVMGAEGPEGYVNHVGVYLGGGKMAENDGSGNRKVVPLASYGLTFMGARRPAYAGNASASETLAGLMGGHLPAAAAPPSPLPAFLRPAPANVQKQTLEAFIQTIAGHVNPEVAKNNYNGAGSVHALVKNMLGKGFTTDQIQSIVASELDPPTESHGDPWEYFSPNDLHDALLNGTGVALPKGFMWGGKPYMSVTDAEALVRARGGEPLKVGANEDSLDNQEVRIAQEKGWARKPVLITDPEFRRRADNVAKLADFVSYAVPILGEAHFAADIEEQLASGDYKGAVANLALALATHGLLHSGETLRMIKATPKRFADALDQLKTWHEIHGTTGPVEMAGRSFIPQPPAGVVFTPGKVRSTEIPAPGLASVAAPNEAQPGVTAPGEAPLPVHTERVDPDSIQVHPTIQYKTGLVDTAANVTGEFKGVHVYDVDQGGTLLVWEDADGNRYIVNGHHRLDIAKRAKRFISTRRSPGQAVEVPREINIDVLKEADGWTLEKARAQGALENIRDGKGNALDGVRVLRDLGLTREELHGLGTSFKSTLGRNIDGLMSLTPEALESAYAGRVKEDVAAGIGSAHLSAKEQSAAMRGAEGLRGYEEGRTFGQRVQRRGIVQEAADSQGSMFGDDEQFQKHIALEGEATKIEHQIRRSIARERSALLRIPNELLEDERINAAERRRLAHEYGSTQEGAKDAVSFVLEKDADLDRQISEWSAKVARNEATTEEAAHALKPVVVDALRGGVERYLKPAEATADTPHSLAGAGARTPPAGPPEQLGQGPIPARDAAPEPFATIAEKERPPGEAPAPAEVTPSPSSAPSGRTAADVRAELDARLEAIKKRGGGMGSKRRGAANFSGEDLKDAFAVGRLRLELGARTFAEWAQAMVQDLGQGIREHLPAIWKQAHEDLGLTPIEREALPGEVTGTAKVVTGRTPLAGVNVHDLAEQGRAALAADPGLPGRAAARTLDTGSPMSDVELSALGARLREIENKAQAERARMSTAVLPFDLEDANIELAKLDEEAEHLLQGADLTMNRGFHRLGMSAQIVYHKDFSLATLRHEVRGALLDTTNGTIPEHIEKRLTEYANRAAEAEAALKTAQAELEDALATGALTPKPAQKAGRDLDVLRKFFGAMPGEIEGAGMGSKRRGAAATSGLPDETRRAMEAAKRLAKEVAPGAKSLDDILDRMRERMQVSPSNEALLRLLSDDYRSHLLEVDLVKRQAAQTISRVRRMAKERLKGKVRRASESVIDFWTITQRSMQAGLDLSMPFLQGRKGLFVAPGAWIKAWGPMLKALKEGDPAAQALMAEIERHPLYRRAVAAGLDLTKVGGPLTEQEETFAGGLVRFLLDTLPGTTKTNPIKLYLTALAHSEAAAGAFMNKLRFDTFVKLAHAAPDNPAYLRDIADTLNTIYGRGASRLAKGIGGSRMVGNVVYAPRFFVSGAEYALGRPLWKARTTLGFKQAAKIYATQALAYGSLVVMAKKAGWHVDTDVRSTDFGKVEVPTPSGPLKVDLFAKEARIYRLVGQLLYGKIDQEGNRRAPSDYNAATILGRFATNQMSPASRDVWEALFGKFDHEKGRRKKRTLDYATDFLPLWLQSSLDHKHLNPLSFPTQFVGLDSEPEKIHEGDKRRLRWTRPGIYSKG